jgi:hypothetical protein
MADDPIFDSAHSVIDGLRNNQRSFISSTLQMHQQLLETRAFNEQRRK